MKVSDIMQAIAKAKPEKAVVYDMNTVGVVFEGKAEEIPLKNPGSDIKFLELHIMVDGHMIRLSL